MISLREQLGERPTAPTLFTLLCPPGWRRMPAAAVASDEMLAPAIAQLKGAGRADLVMQLRAMMARYRAAIRESGAFQAYLAPVVDGYPIPAALLVSPFVLPTGTSWESALLRLTRGGGADSAEFTETPMWVWRRDEQHADSAARLVGRSSHYLVPVPEQDSGRALHFHFTTLVADDPQTRGMVEPLIETGDLIMSTMRWSARAEARDGDPAAPRP